MEELIQQYLFQHRQCPLPFVGLLSVKNGNAVFSYRDHKMTAPLPRIEFDRVEISSDNFISFIAGQKFIPFNEAAASLESYCRKLQNMNSYAEEKIQQVGKFSIDQDGNLVFKAEEPLMGFLPVIPAKKVIHPRISHSIKVGDSETTSAAMADYYNETATAGKERWWIAAVILTLIAAAVLFFYFNSDKYNSTFGNAQPVMTTPDRETYKTGN